MEEEKVTATKSDESAEKKSSGSEKVSAAEDVIKYAETNADEGEKQTAPVQSAITGNVIEAVDSLSGRTLRIPIKAIRSLSRTFYVESIHTSQPIVLAKVYRVSGSFREVIAKIDEETFESLRLTPQFSDNKHVYYNYVSDFLANDPTRGQLLHRTYQVHYPEWIKMEDVLQHDQDTANYFGISLKGIEHQLFPNFQPLKAESTEKTVKKKAIVEPEDEVQDDFSNPKPTLEEAIKDV